MLRGKMSQDRTSTSPDAKRRAPRVMTRREWLAAGAATLASACAARGAGPVERGTGRSHEVETVTGRIPADKLGVTLMHEHVLVDFGGAEIAGPHRYDAGNVFEVVLPHLRQLRTLGCDTLVECTPAYLGRDPALLERLSKASGIQILSNTGYYGAANDKHLPRHAFRETAEQLAARWIREHERGIDGSPVKPAFMKIGVDGAPLSDVDRRLLQAAAVTHRETGLAVASHTGSGAAALEQLDLLEAARVPLSAFIWVHAQSEADPAFHERVAARGAWVEFDGIAPATVERHVTLVRRMKDQGSFGNVLVSHDAGWYRVGEPAGGRFRPYDTLFTAFLPALRASGFTDADVRQLLVANPRRALAGG
jgi:phosphotriesterase-related protein